MFHKDQLRCMLYLFKLSFDIYFPLKKAYRFVLCVIRIRPLHPYHLRLGYKALSAGFKSKLSNCRLQGLSGIQHNCIVLLQGRNGHNCKGSQPYTSWNWKSPHFKNSQQIGPLVDLNLLNPFYWFRFDWVGALIPCRKEDRFRPLLDGIFLVLRLLICF